MFSIEDIIEGSTENSYNRGESYYHSGCVKEITRTGNRFQGTVVGSSPYKVVLKLESGYPEFRCSCPYDYLGLCKHEVAFALAVLNGEYSGEPENKDDSTADIKEFKKYFKNSDTKKKISFLEQLLEKDTDLQSQFVLFVKNESGDLDDITGVNIDEIKENVHKGLSSLDFDSIVENHNPYHGGYYDDEGYIDTANDEICNVFLPFKNRAIEYVKKGNLLDAVRIILGLYEGCQNLPDLLENEYEIYYDCYDNVAMGLLRHELDEISAYFEQVVKNDKQVYKAIDLFIQREEYLDLNFSDIDEEGEDIIMYSLKDFEKFFLAMISNKNTAEYFYRIIRENGLELQHMAFVLLKIAEITDDEKLWIETAEKFAPFDQEIMRKLLEKYKCLNRQDDFNRIAEEAFKTWPKSFNLYLIDNLDRKSKKELYIKALQSYSSGKHSIKHYKKLREYLTEEQKNDFANQMKKGYSDVFYVQILEVEKRYKDILKFVIDNKGTSFNFESIVAPVINIYPDECFNMIRDKCTAALGEVKRNRHTYQRMVKWLKVMSRIDSKQKETKQYIKTLYEHKPNLPALKDEIRKAKF